jgi:TetR/AcrR family transcriptional regulator, transcriptional repressor for nem operon
MAAAKLVAARRTKSQIAALEARLRPDQVALIAQRLVKEQLIVAGLNALLERGFNGVGVQEITEQAGVPKGSLYNHFESKQALGAEIVERYGLNSTRRAVLLDKTVPPLRNG